MKVRFVRRNTDVTRDFTIGNEYDAEILNFGQPDGFGNTVNRHDGIKLTDDAGDVVATAMVYGFEIVSW